MLSCAIVLFSFALGHSAPPAPWPVQPTAVLERFDPPEHPWGPGHRGIDLAAATGQPVRSMTPGRVGFAGTIAGKPVVTVLLADGRRVTYEPVHAAVASGSVVATGALLGHVAASGGHCGGLAGCLHLGLKRGDEYLDPLLLVRRPAILVPLEPPGSALGGVVRQRSGVGLGVGGPESFDRDMGVALGRREGGMAEELLDTAQVGAPLQDMGGRRVPEGVRGDLRHTRLAAQPMDDAADHPWIDAPPARPEEERLAGSLRGYLLAPLPPLLERPCGGASVGHRALAIPLAPHPHRAMEAVDSGEVEGAEL